MVLTVESLKLSFKERRLLVIDRGTHTFSQALFDACVLSIPNTKNGLAFYKWLWQHFSEFFKLEYFTTLYEFCLVPLIQHTESMLMVDHVKLMQVCRSTPISPRATLENLIQYLRWIFETGRANTFEVGVLRSILVPLLLQGGSFEEEIKRLLVQSVMMRDQKNFRFILQSLVEMSINSAPAASEILFKLMTEVGLLGIRGWSCLTSKTNPLPRNVWDRSDNYSMPESQEERVIRRLVDSTSPEYLNMAANQQIAFDILVETREKFPDVYGKYFPAILRRLIGKECCSKSEELVVRILNENSLTDGMLTGRGCSSVFIMDITLLILEITGPAASSAYQKIMSQTCHPVYIATVRSTLKFLLTRNIITINDSIPVENQKAKIIKIFGVHLKLDRDFTWKYAGVATLESLANEILRRKLDDSLRQLGDKCMSQWIEACGSSTDIVRGAFGKYDQFLGPQSLRILLRTIHKWESWVPIHKKVREYAGENLKDYVEGITMTFTTRHFRVGLLLLRNDTEGMIMVQGDNYILGSSMYERVDGSRDSLRPVGVPQHDDGIKDKFSWKCSRCSVIQKNGSGVYKKPGSEHGRYLCINCMDECAGDVRAECMICLSTPEAGNHMTVITCGHTCCSSCLLRLGPGMVKCPLCRKTIDLKDVKPAKQKQPISINRVVEIFCVEFWSKPHEEIREAALKLNASVSIRDDSSSSSSDSDSD